MLPPEQIEGADGVTVIVGLGLTVTVTVVLPVQPTKGVPVTVYVVVVVGKAVTTDPVVPDKPVPGDQLYVLAPPAVSTTLPPGHIEGADGVTVIGKLPGLTQVVP